MRLSHIYVGYDPRPLQHTGYMVSVRSLSGFLPLGSPAVKPILLADLRRRGLYTRPTKLEGGQLWDTISEAPMATEFALSRFFTPILSGYSGWSLFVDGDILARRNVTEIMEYADASKAVLCVQHSHEAEDGSRKMDGQLQTGYERKNWSSVMLFNNEHPANQALSTAMLNHVKGRDLHQFCWLRDDQIGELPEEWNAIPGVTDPFPEDPAIVHYSLGIPALADYCEDPFAETWRAYL